MTTIQKLVIVIHMLHTNNEMSKSNIKFITIQNNLFFFHVCFVLFFVCLYICVLSLLLSADQQYGKGIVKKHLFKSSRVTTKSRRKPLVVNVVVVGPFEEEEEGTGVASDVVKVEGEDPDTPGYLRGDRVRLGRRRSRIVGASPLAPSR